MKAKRTEGPQVFMLPGQQQPTSWSCPRKEFLWVPISQEGSAVRAVPLEVFLGTDTVKGIAPGPQSTSSSRGWHAASAVCRSVAQSKGVPGLLLSSPSCVLLSLSQRICIPKVLNLFERKTILM